MRRKVSCAPFFPFVLVFPRIFIMKGDTPDLYSLLLGASIFYAAYSIIQNITRRLVRSRFVKQHGCKVPARHPLKDPLFGIDGIRAAFRAIASKTFLEQVENQYKEYGNTFSSRRATFDIIYTVEPENIKTILSTKFEDYEVGSHRRRVFSPLLGNSVILLDGVRWEHTRTILRPSFTRSLMNDLPMLEEHISNLLQAIPRDGSTVNLAELFLRMTADVTTDFMFGESVNLLTNPEAFEKKWTAAFQDAMLGCEYRARLGQFASIVPQPKFFDAVKKVHAYMDEHVNKALQYRETLNAKELQGALDIESGAKKRYVFLHELSKLTGDRQTLRNELLTIFFAGRDSTSALLTNVFFLLARHPRVWRKLREEINQLNGARPTLADLKGLEYLGFCLNEGAWLRDGKNNRLIHYCLATLTAYRMGC